MIKDDPVGFLYHEAHLLDRGLLTDWLALFADDATYWLPRRDEDDPAEQVALVYDDHQALRERVQRLTGGFAHSQLPPSRTTRLITNPRVVRDCAEEVEVHAVQLLVEVRRDLQSTYAGSTEHVLARIPGGFRIRRKTVRLSNGNLALGNLTFVF